jgi:hypothetical protein
MLFLAYVSFLPLSLKAYAADYFRLEFRYENDAFAFDAEDGITYQNFADFEETLMIPAEAGKKIVWKEAVPSGEIVEFPFTVRQASVFFASIEDDPDYIGHEDPPVVEDPPVDPNPPVTPDPPIVTDPINPIDPADPPTDGNTEPITYDVNVTCNHANFLLSGVDRNIAKSAQIAGVQVSFDAYSVHRGHRLHEIVVLSDNMPIELIYVEANHHVRFTMPDAEVEIRCYFEMIPKENILTREQIIAVSICGGALGIACICAVCVGIYRRHKKKSASVE